MECNGVIQCQLILNCKYNSMNFTSMFNLKVGSVSCNNVEIYSQMCSPSHTDTSVESASLSSYNDLTEVIEKKLQKISKYHAPENCDRNNFRGLKEKEK